MNNNIFRLYNIQKLLNIFIIQKEKKRLILKMMNNNIENII